MKRILDFKSFVFEAEQVFTTPDMPYQYKVVNGEWMAKGMQLTDWTSMTDKEQTIKRLDFLFPNARTADQKKTVQAKDSTSTGKTDQTAKSTDSGKTEYKSSSTGTGIMACAHAGMWDGGSPAENCLDNIKANISGGTKMIEIDIQFTKDRVPVLFHDEMLDNKTTGNGTIGSKTWEELKIVRYSLDKTQGICRLDDVVKLIRGTDVMLQLDKCDASELEKIKAQGILNGIEDQVIAKGFSSSSSAADSAGIKWMQILPTDKVGTIKTKEAADALISSLPKTLQFFEYQFSDGDTYIVNGYLGDKLRERGVKTLAVAVGGTQNTNGQSYRGDSKTAWESLKKLNPAFIMTNRPRQLMSTLG